MKRKSRLIDGILEIELNMILAIPTQERSRVRENASTFKVVRRCSFELWSIQALKSYLDDLENAQKKDINLMKLKYARMDDLIPTINPNPIIDNIVGIESFWDKRTKREYPNIFKDLSLVKDEDQIRYVRYLRAEFETYSDLTLSYYYINLLKAVKDNRNLVEEYLISIFKSIGYQSLAEANLFLDINPKTSPPILP